MRKLLGGPSVTCGGKVAVRWPTPLTKTKPKEMIVMSIWDWDEVEEMIGDNTEVEGFETLTQAFFRAFGGNVESSPLGEWKQGHLGLNKLQVTFLGEVIVIEYVETSIPGSLRRVWPKFVEYFKDQGIERVWLCDHANTAYDVWGAYGFSGNKGDSHRELIIKTTNIKGDGSNE